jgi:integrase
MLTELQCKNAKPREKPYILSDGNSLYLEIHPNGGRYWRYKYRFLDKQKRCALGVYPETGLAEAREKLREARKLVSNGIDPNQNKREKKREAILEAQNTLEMVARLWHEKKAVGLSPRYANFMWSRIEKDILPKLGSRHINDIRPLEIIDALKRVEARGAHELARRLKQHFDEIYRYAVVHGYASHNPVKDFQSRDVLVKYRKGHFAAIDPSELPEFLKALHANKARSYRLTQLAVELMLLTFVRTGELIKSRWEEINLEEKVWIIPAERMKMRRPHIVPLSNRAVAILEEIKGLTGHREFVFPGQFNPRKTMSDNTILQAIAGMGYKGKMTGHGFRALAMSTLKERLGYRHEVIDVQLAHAKADKIQAAYDRAQFLDERKKMMQHWDDYLQALAEGKDTNVVSLGERKVG